jgi:hypothetical protein
MAISTPAAPRVPSATDRTHYIVNMEDRDLCAVWCGAKLLIEDPITHKRALKDPFECTPAELKSKLDLGKYLGDLVTKNWSQDMIAGVSNSIRVAAQIAPELVNAAVNEVRRNHSLLPVVEAALHDGGFDVRGRIRSRNDTQTVVVDPLGTKLYVFENKDLDSQGRVGDNVHVTRPEGALAFTVATLEQAKAAAPARPRAMGLGI